MDKSGFHTYAAAASDREGRNAEIEALKASLAAEFGPGKFRMERAPDPDGDGPRGEIPSPEFSSRIRWRWRS